MVRDEGLHYRISDAATGLLTEGHVDVRALRLRQPWESPAAQTVPAARPAAAVR